MTTTPFVDIRDAYPSDKSEEEVTDDLFRNNKDGFAGLFDGLEDAVIAGAKRAFNRATRLLLIALSIFLFGVWIGLVVGATLATME